MEVSGLWELWTRTCMRCLEVISPSFKAIVWVILMVIRSPEGRKPEAGVMLYAAGELAFTRNCRDSLLILVIIRVEDKSTVPVNTRQSSGETLASLWSSCILLAERLLNLSNMAKEPGIRQRHLPLPSLVEPVSMHFRPKWTLQKSALSIPASPVGMSPVSPQHFGIRPADTISPFSPDLIKKNGVALARQYTQSKGHFRTLSTQFPPLQSTLKRYNLKLTLSIDNVVTNFAYKTRIGEVSGRPKKQNQDAYILSHLFAPAQKDYLFAVCDGHGLYGHEVSGFIKEQLPRMISASYMQNTESMYEHGLDQAVQGGFRRVVSKLEKSHIDIAYSGSTCVAVVVQGKSLLCANVGDSRALLLSKNNRDWQFTPLSTDHKPDIYTEKMRILSKGGRVSPYKGPRGEVLGPPRVWLRNEDIPGLAMSRSIGDLVASSVGVSPEPEILERTLTPDDKMLILGSDGLWDYMSNEEVMRVASTYWGNGDLEGCCEHLVTEALGKWKRENDGIDDITVVVALLQVPESPPLF